MKPSIRNLALTGLLIAMGIILPVLLHAIPNAGTVLSPMHLPVLLCGLVCGWPFGLACGILTPLISSLITGMPPAAYLPGMLCELAVYGLLAGVFIQLIHTKRPIVDICASLLAAMLAGRVVYGIVNALIFRAGSYSMQIWMTGVFITPWPGILAQLILIPAIMFALGRAGLIGERFKGGKAA